MVKVRFLAVWCIFLICIGSSFGLIYSQEFPSEVFAQKEYSSKIMIYPENVSSFDFGQMFPKGSRILDWSVEGNTSAVVYEINESFSYLGSSYSVSHWKFQGSADIVLNYDFIFDSTGSFKFNSVVTYPEGVLYNSTTIASKAEKKYVCGNGICELEFGEDEALCSADCAVSGVNWIPYIILSGGVAVMFIGLMFAVIKHSKNKEEEAALKPEVKKMDMFETYTAPKEEVKEVVKKAPVAPRPLTPEEEEKKFWKEFDASLDVNKYEGIDEEKD